MYPVLQTAVQFLPHNFLFWDILIMLTLIEDSRRMPRVERPHILYSEQTPLLAEVTVSSPPKNWYLNY